MKWSPLTGISDEPSHSFERRYRESVEIAERENICRRCKKNEVSVSGLCEECFDNIFSE